MKILRRKRSLVLLLLFCVVFVYGVLLGLARRRRSLPIELRIEDGDENREIGVKEERRQRDERKEAETKDSLIIQAMSQVNRDEQSDVSDNSERERGAQ